MLFVNVEAIYGMIIMITPFFKAFRTIHNLSIFYGHNCGNRYIFLPVAMVRPGEAEHPTEVLWAQEHGSQGYFQARPWSIPGLVN